MIGFPAEVTVELGIFFIIAIVVIAIVVLIVFFNQDARVKRALRRVPLVRIVDFSDGAEARLVGKVLLLEEFCAPLSGRPCAHYHLEIEHRRSSGKSSHWVTIIDDAKTVDFIVDDGSGRAIVETGQSQFAVVRDANARSGTFKDATPELEKLLQQYGESSSGLLGFNKTLRYREGVIEAEEMVAVFGKGQWIKDSGGKRQLVISKPAETMVLISDDPSTTKQGMSSLETIHNGKGR